MVDPIYYRQQAESNETSAITAQLDYPDWAVVMCFYAAIHFINDHAYRYENLEGLIPEDENIAPHKQRRLYLTRIVLECKDRINLLEAYDLLYNTSMKARYLKKLQNCSARDYYKKTNLKPFFEALDTVKKILN